MDRIWIDASENPQSLVSNRVEPRIDSCHAGRCDCDQPRLVQVPLLKVAKIESPILRNRTADGNSILRLCNRKNHLRKRIGGVEALVAEISIHVAVHGVRSTFRDHVQVTAEGSAKFRLPTGGYCLEPTTCAV